MTDYERGVEQASAIYKEVIREYVSDNAKLRELCEDMWDMAYPEAPSAFEAEFAGRMRALGIEVPR